MKTKNTTHTPGPWEVRGTMIYGPDSGPGTAEYVGECERKNLFLISAAPEMLAALKAQHSALLVKIYKGSTSEEAGQFHHKSCPNCSTCAAIDKAEGR